MSTGRNPKRRFGIDVFSDEGGGTAEDPETPNIANLDTLFQQMKPLLTIDSNKEKTAVQLFSNEDKLRKNASQVDVYRRIIESNYREVRALTKLVHLISKTISSCGFSIQFARIATDRHCHRYLHYRTLESKEPIDPARFLQLRTIRCALYEGKFTTKLKSLI